MTASHTSFLCVTSYMLQIFQTMCKLFHYFFTVKQANLTQNLASSDFPNKTRESSAPTWPLTWEMESLQDKKDNNNVDNRLQT